MFLDEFGELSLEAQVRLLRVLQQGEITPLGTAESETVDVRIVAATNRDLPSMIAAGKFREDLYYRVAMGVLKLPPLRDRGGDLQLLSKEFLDQINSEFGDINRTINPVNLAAVQSELSGNIPGQEIFVNYIPLYEPLVFGQSIQLSMAKPCRAPFRSLLAKRMLCFQI